jgi:hypothetical protein
MNRPGGASLPLAGTGQFGTVIIMARLGGHKSLAPRCGWDDAGASPAPRKRSLPRAARYSRYVLD